MDVEFREIQRRISQGETELLDYLDVLLQRHGAILIGKTSPYGDFPNTTVFIVQASFHTTGVDKNLWSVLIRNPGGNTSFLYEELDEPGEHIGVYFRNQAEQLANSIINSAEPTWIPDDECPKCLKREIILIDSIDYPSTPSGPGSTEITLRCVNCGHEWADYIDHWI